MPAIKAVILLKLNETSYKRSSTVRFLTEIVKKLCDEKFYPEAILTAVTTVKPGRSKSRAGKHAYNALVHV